jgi:hypothetical protein
VNWLPINPREYVAASAASTMFIYSPLLTLSLGCTLMLALGFGLLRFWPLMTVLSVLAVLLGALVVEVLRAVVNRVSSAFYKRSGKIAVATRLLLLMVVFVMVNMAFNPYVLYQALGAVISGVDLFWFVPMIWPSVALISLTRLDISAAAIFSALSAFFTVLVFEAASRLRQRYWSPMAINVVIRHTVGYSPHIAALPVLGVTPLARAIALKEFRGLIRRKDMARFLAIPVLLVVSYLLPTTMGPDYSYSGRSPGLFLSVFVPYLVPLMFSTIAIGNEGKSVINLFMLPMSSMELMVGKLLPTWLVSATTMTVTMICFEVIAPMRLWITFAASIAGLILVVVEGFIGLGVGSRFPDYDAGSKSMYVSSKGLIIGYLVGGASARAIFTPLFLYLVLNGGVRGSTPTGVLSLPVIFSIAAMAGLVLSYLAYRYCRSGLDRLNA